MSKNRALEFLEKADRIMANLSYTNRDTAHTLIRLAVGEVGELLARIAELEAMTPTHSGGGVLIVEAQPMTPAKLTEAPRTLQMLEWLQRKALPGNGKQL